MKAAAFLKGASPLFLWVLLVLVGSLVQAEEPEAGLKKLQFSRPQMGSVFYITLYAADEAKAGAAMEAAYQRVEAINAAASDYLPESELSRLNRAPEGQPVKVSEDLFQLLAKSAEMSRMTEGAFDVTSAYAVQLWRRAKRKKKLPAPEEVQKAVALADWTQVELDEKERTVTKLKAGVLLDFGGIGKGYAADAALKVLKEHGITRVAVAASGDLAFGDPPPGKAGWDVALRTFEKPEEADRFEHVTLSNCGCSTSGDVHQFLELEGRRYSHIVNPKTGLGLTDRLGCSVIARDATTADALATALCVMGVEKSSALLKDEASHRGLQVRLTWLEDGGSEMKSRELNWRVSADDARR